MTPVLDEQTISQGVVSQEGFLQTFLRKRLSSMTVPLRPKLRPLEILPIRSDKQLLFTLRDPEGFGQMVVMPYGALLLTALMDGERTLSEIQSAFESQTGAQAPLVDLEESLHDINT